MSNEIPRSPNEGGNQAKDFFDKHPLLRMHAAVLVRLKMLMHPDSRERDNFVGLMMGSIIANPLHFPDEAEGGELGFRTTTAGDWIGYDFWRPKLTPPRKDGTHRQLCTGTIFAFMLEDIKGLPADALTLPRDMRAFDNLITLDKPGIKTLVDEEYVRPTTYGEAYRQARRYEEFAGELATRGIVDARVYQVTPKGNSLIMLEERSGNPSPKPKHQFESVFSPLPRFT